MTKQNVTVKGECTCMGYLYEGTELKFDLPHMVKCLHEIHTLLQCQSHTPIITEKWKWKINYALFIIPVMIFMDDYCNKKSLRRIIIILLLHFDIHTP